MQNNNSGLSISTNHLILRKFLPSDWEAVSNFLSDPDVTKYMHFATYTVSDLKKWFDWCLANNQLEHPVAYNWGIVLKVTNQVIGWFGIGEPDILSIPGERDFGFALDKYYWGNGYMTEALQAIMAYEFEQLEAKRIFATCETENIASARVMEKAEMQYEGTFYGADFEGNERYRHRYGIDYQEFISIRWRF